MVLLNQFIKFRDTRKCLVVSFWDNMQHTLWCTSFRGWLTFLLRCSINHTVRLGWKNTNYHSHTKLATNEAQTQGVVQSKASCSLIQKPTQWEQNYGIRTCGPWAELAWPVGVENKGPLTAGDTDTLARTHFEYECVLRWNFLHFEIIIPIRFAAHDTSVQIERLPDQRVPSAFFLHQQQGGLADARVLREIQFFRHGLLCPVIGTWLLFLSLL